MWTEILKATAVWIGVAGLWFALLCAWHGVVWRASIRDVVNYIEFIAVELVFLIYWLLTIVALAAHRLTAGS